VDTSVEFLEKVWYDCQYSWIRTKLTVTEYYIPSVLQSYIRHNADGSLIPEAEHKFNSNLVHPT